MSNEAASEAKPVSSKKPSIGRLTLAEVDANLADYEKVIKACSEAVKVRLNNNANISTNILRDLSHANAKRAKLMMRRITLLIETGDSAVSELLEKLMKVKPAKLG